MPQNNHSSVQFSHAVAAVRCTAVERENAVRLRCRKFDSTTRVNHGTGLMKLHTHVLLAAYYFPAMALADPAAIKARVEEPALLETMGGC